ncbi:MAG: arylesterase [Hyphomicrobiales bacterium]|nr:MAG: arylesterase [Hyphomicrobiales bacterium]
MILLVWLIPAFAPATAGAAPAGAPVITVLGDSLSAGYGLARNEAFPAQLQQALTAEGLAAEIRNAGVSGDTAEDGLARLDWAVAGDVRAVILALGANDALRGHAPARMKKALEQILARLKARNIAVLLAGMKSPRNMGPEYIAAYDRVFPELALKYDAILLPFYLEGVAARPELNLSDGLHPNPQGVARMVQNALPYVKKLINRIGRRN